MFGTLLDLGKYEQNYTKFYPTEEWPRSRDPLKIWHHQTYLQNQ